MASKRIGIHRPSGDLRPRGKDGRQLQPAHDFPFLLASSHFRQGKHITFTSGSAIHINVIGIVPDVREDEAAGHHRVQVLGGLAEGPQLDRGRPAPQPRQYHRVRRHRRGRHQDLELEQHQDSV